MKLVVFSDSHGHNDRMRSVIRMQKNADAFLHLGDGAPDFLFLCEEASVTGFAVRGNCDLCSTHRRLEKTMTLTFEGVRLFLTHGDGYQVNWSTVPLSLAAKEAACLVALYGHTHIAENRYLPPMDENDRPLYLFNPGSISKPRDGAPSYGVIELNMGQVLLNTVKL